MNRSFQREISRQSERAPGLPYPPIGLGTRLPGTTHYLEVSSINYDYLPTALDSPKTLWVDLTCPPPGDMMVGTSARFHMTPNQGIQTQMSSRDPRNSWFEISDIIGSRVILSPYRGSTWLPTVHSSCDNPMGWGYGTRMTNVSTSMHNNKYGYGAPISYLEYHPIYYSNRATQLEAVQLEEDFYRGSKYSPGWQYS